MLIKLLFSLVALHISSIEGYLGVEWRDEVHYIKLGGDCSIRETFFVMYDDTITVKCPFRPIGWIYRTKPDWKFNYQIVKSNSSIFSIHSVKYTNDGCVCCRSMEDFSVACTHVKVQGPPIRNSTYWSIATNCDRPIEIRCPYTGYPPLNYTWLYSLNRQELPLPEVFKSQIHNPELIAKEFSPEIHGMYQCTVKNKYGTEGDTLVPGKEREIKYPQDCQGYTQYRRAYLSSEHTGTIGGNITLTCFLQFDSCIQDCSQYIKWDSSAFPLNRTINGKGYNCSICEGWQSRTIINLQRSDFNKSYTCNIGPGIDHATPISLNTTLKLASFDTQSFNAVPALVPTAIILIIVTLTTLITTFLGVHYKKKITMFFYYRLAKEPSYEKGLRYDAFISFSSRDIDFVKEKIHDVIKDAGYEVIWYPDHFQGGDIILPKARDSIWKSRKTILCLSENFLRSEYCAAEKDFCFEKAMETFKNFIIIIHLDYCEIPADLRKLKIIEMNHETENQRDYSKGISNLKYLLRAPIDKML